MYEIIWYILPNTILRTIAAIALLLAIIILVALEVKKEKWIYNKLNKLKIYWRYIAVTAAMFIQIIIAWNIVCRYWYIDSIAGYFSNIYNLYISILLFIIAVFCIGNIFKEIAKNIFLFNSVLKADMIKDIVKLCVISTATYYELGILRDLQNHSEGGYDESKMLCVTVIFLIINKAIIYAFDLYSRAKEYEKQLALMEMHNEMQYDKYSTVYRNSEENQKLVHDIQKHLHVLDSLVAEKSEEIFEYEEKIKRQLTKLSGGFDCENEIVRAIMNQKISEAEDKGIKINVDMTEFEWTNIQDIDITSILANMWDNAIEAACKDIVNPYIDIVVCRVNDFIVISFENNFDKNINYLNDDIVSTKSGNHGYGLKIIDNAAKKYGGSLNISIKEDVFSAKVILQV